MDFSHVTSILLATLALTIAISTASPYPSSWFDPSDASTDKDDSYPSNYIDARDTSRLRQVLKLLRQENPNSYDKYNEGQVNLRNKRLDFGFAGLDNMDHILSTLDRNNDIQEARSGSRFYNNLKSKGYKGGNNMETLTKLMANVG